MAHYLLSVCYPETSTPPGPAELDQIMAAVGELNDDMKSAGAWVFGGGLTDPSIATVVESRRGDAVLTDGPFVETKEQIGGFTIIDVEDLDAALVWADRMSQATTTPIEVRPFAGIG